MSDAFCDVYGVKQLGSEEMCCDYIYNFGPLYKYIKIQVLFEVNIVQTVFTRWPYQPLYSSDKYK